LLGEWATEIAVAGLVDARAYAEVLAVYGTREQELRDDQGQLAEYLDDFRPSSPSSGS